MYYALDPRKAEIMLDLCQDGNHIYEVSSRLEDGSIQFSYVQAPSAEAAEAQQLTYPWTKSAVARLIKRM